MADEAPKPAVGLHHNQVYVLLSGFVASVFINYMVARDNITTLSVKVGTLEAEKVRLELLITKEADKNEKYRDAMKESVVKMETIIEERNR